MLFGSGGLRLSCTAGFSRMIADHSKPSGFSSETVDSPSNSYESDHRIAQEPDPLQLG
jgi:hypothetical protein